MDLEFQIYDYRETHINLDEDSEVETMGEYVVQVFGRTMDGKSVYAKLTNFQPRFYIGIPQKWSNREISRMEKYLKSSENKSIWKMHRDCLTKVGLVKKKKAYGFTNNKIFKYAVLFFTNLWACKKFSYLFEHRKVYIPGVTSKGLKFNIYESNLAPLIRCFHIQDIPGCGWVKSDSHTLVDKSEKESICDYEIMLPYTNLLPIEKDCNAPLRICSFDIECYSYDGMFPQARRSKDKIIQIGSTYNYLGNKEIYRQHIVTLDTCNKIEGAVVESFDNEKDLLRGWVNEIKSHDVDILTGYNIFYFDEKYIYDRAKLLNIDFDVSYMSKLNTYKCKFLEQKLASNALGENILKYYDTPGIVHIDLMKDVQKTYKLESYKLDKVAGSFIKGEVESIKKVKKNKYELYCKKITDLRKDDYIHLELQESYVSEDIGEKFPIYKLDLEKNIITLKTDLDLVEECDFERGKVFWSQAKDDVPPKMIFKMQTMGPKERCIVAKYCLKDCILVNLLVEKLQVVTKNIEMANVCYVPLSYIFVRGQGVKLFSLCLKEFRKSGFIFPVMRKPEEDLGKYEGAIVFDPIPAVNYQAFAVKDYASLYPSSIIHKNMSHETKVDNPEYDNLEEVEYFNAQFVDNEGNINYRRYAKLKGEYGMVPKILQNLLGERKAVKKLMKTEKDNFKYGILDAKQLALKITANSLYGQLGASTSPVRERDTAACTTSTGREMLILAKKYDEEILPWMINGLQIAYMNGDSETVDNIYKKELKDCEDEKLKEKIEKFCKRTEGLVFNPIVKYGDSVIGDTSLLLKNKLTNKIFISKIKDLANSDMNYVKYHDTKESCELKNILTWTEKGWTEIKRVIRHKLSKDKKLLKINTHQGVVVVTDEHSLLNKDGDMIDASKVKIGDELLHSFPKEEKIEEKYSDECEVLRLYYNYRCDNKNIKVISRNKKYELVECESELDNKIVEITEWSYRNEEEYVYDLTTENHHFHAGVGSMIVHNTDSIFSCYQYRKDNKEISDKKTLSLLKKIMSFGKDLLGAFIPKKDYDMYSEIYDKYYGEIKSLKLPTKLKVKPIPEHNEVVLPIEDRLKQLVKEYVEESYFPWLWTLHDMFALDLSYLDASIREEIVDIRLFKWGNKQIGKIRIEEQLFSDADKYDLILRCRTFCNDILGKHYLVPYWKYKKNKLEYRVKITKNGELIKDKSNLDYSVELGIISGDTIKSRLALPQDLEYEKTFWPYLILTKKRYVGNKYEFDLDKFKFDFMGIVLKRRDNAPIVKEICSGIINKLIVERDPEGAYKFLEDCLTKMFNDEYNIKYFLQSRTLKAKESYVNWTRIAHVVLAERIGERDPGNKPQPGDRIMFAAIEVEDSKHKLQGDRIEIPEYIKEKGLKVDYFFYLTNQIEKPALQFLKLAIPNVEKRLDDFKIIMRNKRDGIKMMSEFIEPSKMIDNYLEGLYEF